MFIQNPDRHRAYELFKEDNPACIPLLEQDGSYGAKAKLAQIYTYRKCSQERDLEKALSYTKDNPNPNAVCTECDIIIFLQKKLEYAETCYRKLQETCLLNPTANNVKKMIGRFYFNGYAVPTDFQMACKYNPDYQMPDKFSKAFDRLTDSQKDALKHCIETSNPELMRTLLGSYNQVQEMNEFNRAYDEKIQYLKNNNSFEELNTFLSKSFKESPSQHTAYGLFRYCNQVTVDEYWKAVSYLGKDLDNYSENILILDVATKLELWAAVEQRLIELKGHSDNYWYYEGLQEEHKRNRKRAEQIYVKGVVNAVKMNVHTHKAAENLYEMDPANAIRYDKCLENLLNSSNFDRRRDVAKTIYPKASAEQKHQIEESLKEIADKDWYAAKLYSELTGNKLSLKCSGVQNNPVRPNNRYRFNRTQPTSEIEKNYSSLSTRWKLEALEVLAENYIRGTENNSEDKNKAAFFLRENIALREKIGLPTIYEKAKLGLLIYDNSIEIPNPNPCFEYMYPLRKLKTYEFPVADCYLKGIGTEKDLDKGYEILDNSACTLTIKRYLTLLSNTTGIPDYPKIFSRSRYLLNAERPDTSTVTAYELSSEKVPNAVKELSYSQVQKMKIKRIMSKSSDCRMNPCLNLRYLDFARNLGDEFAAINEAAVILKFYSDPKIAYTILKTSNVPETNKIYLRIDEKDKVIINLEKELPRYFDGTIPITNIDELSKIAIESGINPEDLETFELDKKYNREQGCYEILTISKISHAIFKLIVNEEPLGKRITLTYQQYKNLKRLPKPPEGLEKRFDKIVMNNLT